MTAIELTNTENTKGGSNLAYSWVRSTSKSTNSKKKKIICDTIN